MINMLMQFPDLKQHDLTTLEALGYGGSPMAPELIHRTKQLLPNAQLVQIYGLTETGFLTGLRNDEHTEARLMSCGRTCPGIDLGVVNESGKEVEAGSMANWWLEAQMSCAAIGTIRMKPRMRSETDSFAPETSAIAMPMATSTSWTARRT